MTNIVLELYFFGNITKSYYYDKSPCLRSYKENYDSPNSLIKMSTVSGFMLTCCAVTIFPEQLKTKTTSEVELDLKKSSILTPFQQLLSTLTRYVVLQSVEHFLPMMCCM